MSSEKPTRQRSRLGLARPHSAVPWVKPQGSALCHLQASHTPGAISKPRDSGSKKSNASTIIRTSDAWPLTLHKPKALSPRRGQKLSGEETQRNVQRANASEGRWVPEAGTSSSSGAALVAASSSARVGCSRLAPAQRQPAGLFRHVRDSLHLAAEHWLSKTSCLCYFQTLGPSEK